MDTELNLEGCRELDIHRYVAKIRGREVREALKKMKGGKTLGPDGIPIEVWKAMGEKGVMWLARLFNSILKTKKMPEDWRQSIIVPIYKNKGDAQDCNNYRGIKLMSHTNEALGKSH